MGTVGELGPSSLSDHLELSMVVAVAIVLMVQVAIDQVIDMVAVRDRGMSASRSVHVVGRVGRADMSACAGGWVMSRDLQDMLFDRPVEGRVMQVSIVEVVDMSIMFDCRMPAIFSVDMVMVFVVV
jgi:hypothetical protein